MTSSADILPTRLVLALEKLGGDISIARRRRRMTIQDICARTNLSVKTYRRIEAGEPTVSMMGYAIVLDILGMGDRVGALAAPDTDLVGHAADIERLPRRVVHSRKTEDRDDAADSGSSW